MEKKNPSLDDLVYLHDPKKGFSVSLLSERTEISPEVGKSVKAIQAATPVQK